MQRNMKYQLIFVRMAIIKTKDKCWINCGETETLAFCWQKAKWCSFYEKHDGSSKKKKKKNTTSYDPTIVFLSIYPKELKAGS